MSEYFSDKDSEQSFDMPTDNQSIPPSGTNQEPEQPQGSPFQSSGVAQGEENQNQDMIYMVVMTVIIFVMIYSLYSMFFSGSSEDDKDQSSNVAIVESLNQPEKKEAVVPESQPVQKNVVPETKTPVTSSAEEKKMSDSIDELVAENNYLTTMVRKLNDDNLGVQRRFNELESEIDDLVSKNDTMQKQISDLQKKLQPKKKEVKVKEAKETYTVEAVVEGRAWLVSGGGANKTVKVGDELKDYGSITKIDAVNSIVYTTSNRQIKVN